MGPQIRHFVRYILVSACAYFGASAFYRACLRKRGPLVRVVVFHDVTDPTWFSRCIAELSRHYNVVTPNDFFTEKFDSKRINILITFDDGYASWVTICQRILLQYNMKGIFFVNSGLLDAVTHDAQEQFVRERLLLHGAHTASSWEELKLLKAKGHTIGGHTATHARLSELNILVQRDEIVGDKKRIEEMLFETLKDFAYPFGNRTDYTAETKTLVKENGYERAFSTEARFVTDVTSMTIPRLCLEEGMSMHMLKLWIGGSYDLYVRIKKLCVG